MNQPGPARRPPPNQPATDLPAMDVAGRLPRLRAALDAAGCDALLVTNLKNIRYLTGFTGSAALLLVAPDELLFVTDGRYQVQSADQLARAGVQAEIAVGAGPAQRDAVAAAAAGIGRLGLEATNVTWAAQRTYSRDWFPDTELVPTMGVVEVLRRVKDAGEVARIGEAARIADAALARVRPMLTTGLTEVEFGQALDFEIRRLGATGNSFETIVASGPNGARPHHRPSPRRIGAGELVVLDFGAVVDGYCSDITRTVSVGDPASATLERMVEVVGASQAAGVAAVRAGATSAEIDQACRQTIARLEPDWAAAFVHSTGHGVGLDIHEAPAVSATSPDTLAVGHVVTVEPGVYLPEHGGVRIEDTVVVTETGCTPLTHAPKELIVR